MFSRFNASVDLETNAFLFSEESDQSNSDSDEIDSDVEFHLYSQLHYSSNLGGDDSQEEPPPELVAEKSDSASADDVFTKSDVINENKASEESTDDGETSEEEVKESQNEKVGPFSKREIELLKKFLSDDEEEEFVPETWEILDSVEEVDSDDEGVHIHISEPPSEEASAAEEEEEEENDISSPEKVSTSKDCWKIDDRDRPGFKQDSRGRYYSDAASSGARCRNCNEVGHKARNCPEGRKQPVCFMCGDRGHIGKDCPERQNHKFANWRTTCNRCRQEGHIQAECPDLWRQFHLTTRVGPIVIPNIPVELNDNIHCYNCADEGHFGHECEEEGNKYYYPMQQALVHRYDEHAVVKMPQDLRKKLKAKRTKQDETPDYHERRHMPSSSKWHEPPRKRPQHIIFDTSSTEQEEDNRKSHRPRKERDHRHEQEKFQHHERNQFNDRKQSKHHISRHRNQHQFDQDYADSKEKSNDYHKNARSMSSKYNPNSEFSRKRTSYHEESKPPRKKSQFDRLVELVEPFPRSHKSNEREHSRNDQKFARDHGKKRRHDDRNRKQFDRGFKKRFK